MAARTNFPARTSSLMHSNTTTLASAATPIVKISPANPGRVSVTLNNRRAARPGGKWGLPSRAVLVVSAQPHVTVALVAALRRPVEDRVVAHQELSAAGVARIAVVDAVAVAREGADAVPLSEVADDVGAGCCGVLHDHGRQALADARVVQERKRCDLVGLEQRDLVRCAVGNGDTEVELEVALVTRGPVEAPPHPLAVGEQLLERRVLDADHRDVPGLEVREHAVEAVRRRRAGRTARRVVRPEHEVVDDELRAAVEQLRQRAFAILGVEAVLLLQRDPRELTALPGDIVAEPRVLLLANE